MSEKAGDLREREDEHQIEKQLDRRGSFPVLTHIGRVRVE
jgi:hypothetical protein